MQEYRELLRLGLQIVVHLETTAQNNMLQSQHLPVHQHALSHQLEVCYGKMHPSTTASCLQPYGNPSLTP